MSHRSLLAALATLAAAHLAAATAANAQTFTTLKSFTDSDFRGGALYGYGSGLTLSDGMLYSAGATIYKVSTNGGGFAVVHQFTGGSEGSGPVGRVVVSGNTLYGVTRTGGSTAGADPGDTFGHGIIYRVNTDGTGFSVLRRFNKPGGDGFRPSFGLVLSGSALYGTAQGGTFGHGVVFKINTNGSGYQNIHSFNYSTEGSQPQSELTLIGNTLFGTALSGRIGSGANGGILFKIGVDGTGFSVLRTFKNPSFAVGGELINGLTAVGGTLYGVGSDYGFAPDFGTPKSSIYKINTDGTGFQIIRQLPPGSQFGGILAWTGSELLGSWHDSSPSGGIFRVNPDGTGYFVIKTFQGHSNYVADLVFSGTTLYSGTLDFDFGEEPSTLFSLDVRPRLAIDSTAGGVKLTWPSYAQGYQLEQNPALSSPGWTNVTTAPSDDGTNRMATLPVSPTTGSMFFRLRR